MPSPAPDPSSPLDRVRSLFARASSLPPGQRESFVRAQAGADAKLRDEVLALLKASEVDTAGLGNAVRQSMDDAVAAAASAPSTPGANAPNDLPPSTATGELLAKLAQAPKLDTERYSIETEIGRGGMGSVLRIHDRRLNRRLAMKVLLERPVPRSAQDRQLSQQLLSLFLEEAMVTSQLDHPGVVPVHELGLDENGRVYFTMRLVKGQTATQVFELARAGQEGWTITRGLEIVLRVCDTMAYAHDKGVLHRDLKPSNVMVGRFGEVYVMDWGLAKVLGQADRLDRPSQREEAVNDSYIESLLNDDAKATDSSALLSLSGERLGTPSYMSPEQARGKPLDQRADVYSIGAMVYELLTGRAPYRIPGQRQPAYRILDDVLNGPPKRIDELQPSVPAELVAIVERAMHREHSERYANVLDLAADLRAFLAQRVVKAYRTGAMVEMKLWVRRNRALAASLVVAILLLVGGIVTTTWLAKKAEAKASALSAKIADFDRLALVVDYDRLVKEERELGSAYPDQLAAIIDWRHRAEHLIGMQGEIVNLVNSMQRDPSLKSESERDPDSIASSAETPSGRGDGAARFLATALEDLRKKLPHLSSMVPAMKQRERWSSVIGPLTLSHPNAMVTWAQARVAISENPRYAGQNIPLRDCDIWGMVPIGENPQSRLWEFYDLRSAWDGIGDPESLARLPIPSHDQHGRITITGDIGIVWVLLPGGRLPALPSSYRLDVGDQHEAHRRSIWIEPFFIAKHETTQGQWHRWTRDNPSRYKARNDLSLPVESVTWIACHDTLKGLGLALPSELQWEYAIRAGTTTRSWNGEYVMDTERGPLNVPNHLGKMENIGRDTSILPVGRKEPNPFGLFDLGGNVWEWCYDEHGPYGSERPGDGRRPDQSSGSVYRCFRGGSFGKQVELSESGNRFRHLPTYSNEDLGVRPVRPASR